MKFVKIILSLCLLAFAGFSIYWFVMSTKLENEFKFQIDKLIEEGDDGYHLKYESIERGGYPFNFSFTLNNPTISFYPTGKSSTQPAQIKLDGQITDYFNLTGDLESIKYSGRSNILIPREENNSPLRFLFEGDVFIKNDSGSLIPVSTLKNLANLDEILDEVWSNINLENSVIKLHNIKIYDLNKNKLLTQFESSTLRFMHKNNAASQSIQLWSDVKKVIFSNQESQSEEKNFDDSQQFYDLFTEALSSKIGEFDIDFNLNMEFPKQKELNQMLAQPLYTHLLNPFPTILLDIKETSFKEDFFKNNTSLRSKTNHDEQGYNLFSIKIEGDSLYSKKMVEAFFSALRKTHQAASKFEPSEEQDKILKNLLIHHYEELASLIPQLDHFGKIEHLFDLNVKFNKKEMKGEITLNEFSFLTALYGFKLQGEGKGGLGSFSSSADLTLSNAKSMFNDLIASANKIIRIMNIVGKMKEQAPFNEIPIAFVDRLMTYLHEISNDPQSRTEDVHILFSYNNNEKKVGTLSIEEFTEKTKAFLEEMQQEYFSQNDSALES